MYITANLPSRYGQFNLIRKDNYPFRNTFVKYLETISSLGLSLGVDADLLVGIIEDALLGNERLPDIPDGDEPVKFRFTTDNETVCKYFEDSELPNKTINMLVVRMTLRLSVKFGTSLSRLTKLISEITPEGAIAERPTNQPKPVKEPEERPAIHVTTKPVEPHVIPKDEPKGDVLERLNELVEKSNQLLSESGDAPVVETNPALADFF